MILRHKLNRVKFAAHQAQHSKANLFLLYAIVGQKSERGMVYLIGLGRSKPQTADRGLRITDSLKCSIPNTPISSNAGLVTNSIIYFWLFTIKDQCAKSAFLTNAQSRFASVVVEGVLGPPRLARLTWRCPCISVVPEATKRVEGPRRRRGSCWEEQKRKVFPRRGVIHLSSEQIDDFLRKGNRKKLS